MGKQENSNRESVITFLSDEIAAVRWRNYRIYPKQFIKTEGSPVMTEVFGARTETNLYPLVFNTYKDPNELHNILADNAWVLGSYF